MLGKVLTITKNSAIVSVNKETVSGIKDLINLHVVFEDSDKKILGEVDSIEQDTIKVSFLGELTDNDFIGGLIKKPSLDANVRIINQEELKILTGNEDRSIRLGVSPLYNDFPLNVNIDELFSNHTAIFGNTGSGKTYGICRIIQNIFLNTNFLSFNANLFIFDAYGEYKNAFRSINNINPNYQYKFLTTNPTDESDMLLQVPIFLLSNDDIALLLNADNHAQLTIIERTMKLVKIFSKNDEMTEKYKNHLIAKAIQSVLFSNETSSAKKNNIFTIIASCSTAAFNMNTDVQGVGFTRKLSDCFKIDSKGEFSESVLINEYIAKNIDESLEGALEAPKNAFFTIRDLAKALDFTLIGEGFLNNRIMQDSAIILKVRLNSIINSRNANFFEINQYITLEQYISSLIILNNKRSQIININLEDVDDNFAKVMVKVLSKMIFDFAKSRKVRASIPFHLIIEEAHRYVQNDNDKFLLGYNIFERIAKEGRKYGVMIDLISQRPVDVSETVVAQMSNFLVLKMTHPKDLEYIEKMLPNVSSDIIEKLNSLQSGTLVAFGNAFKIPLLIKMDLPDPRPYSSNCDVVARWKGEA